MESKKESGNIILENGIKGVFIFFLILVWTSKVFDMICFTLGINTKKLVRNYDELLNLASIIRRRLIALSIDYTIPLILFFITYLGIYIFGFNAEIINKYEYAYLFLGLSFILIEEVVFKKTIGKKMMGLVVLTENFQIPSRMQLLIRNICKFSLFNPVLGTVYMFFSYLIKKIGF